MHLVEIVRRPTAAQRDAVARFVETVTTAAGARPLSDHLWLDLRSPEGSPLLITIADHDGVLALAQISMANDNSVLELVVAPRVDDDSVTQITTDLVETAVEAFRHDGGGNLSWWVDDPAPAVAELARRCTLEPGRTLYEMRRALPTGRPAEVATRPFEPGIDNEDWLAVNNRAFAAHGEQGGWTSGTLAARLAEPWFDADGFRLHERDGRLAAFCWTKLHLEFDPVVGEIYVIAVDPDFHGLGLGRQLTLAGLDSIAARGVRVANLYVDAHNEAAVSLYRSLDFDVHHTRQVFTGRQPGERRDRSTNPSRETP